MPRGFQGQQIFEIPDQHLGIMLRYKMRMRRWFTDLDLGLKMLARGKLDLKARRVKAVKEIRGLFLPRRQG
jgi:hypothetical protein